MKIAFFCYHANAQKLYKKEWLDQYRDSVLNQTIKDLIKGNRNPFNLQMQVILLFKIKLKENQKKYWK